MIGNNKNGENIQAEYNVGHSATRVAAKNK